MDISGVVFAILEPQTGTGKNGEWIKHRFVIETPGQYPKKVQFDWFNKDPNAQLAFGEGDNVTVSFNLESREYNGKWYSNINAYKVTTEGQRAQQNKPSSTPKPKPTQGAAATDDDFFATPTSSKKAPPPTDDDDGLPF